MTLINPPGISLVAPSLAPAGDRDAAQRALDELFQFARQYANSQEFKGLIDFIARFRLYSPFNALLA